jgi:hypothetical protein
MNTSPDLLGGLEKCGERPKTKKPVRASEPRAGDEPRVQKICTCIRDVAIVLGVARKQLMPEVEKVAFRLVLLGTFLFELLKYVTRR